MSKRQALIVIGIWIAVFLFLGFPSSGDKALALFTGIIIVWIAFRMKPSSAPVDENRLPYVEHKNDIHP